MADELEALRAKLGRANTRALLWRRKARKYRAWALDQEERLTAEAVYNQSLRKALNLAAKALLCEHRFREGRFETCSACLNDERRTAALEAMSKAVDDGFVAALKGEGA